MLNLLQNYYPQFFQGFVSTIYASIIGLFFSLLVGTLMGMLQVSENKILRTIGNVYVEFFRNIPLLIIVMFFYVAVPLYVTSLSGFTAGVIGLIIYTSSFVADNVRAGILSVAKGQREAALSQGMTTTQAMRYVILPQAVRIVLPPLGNQAINLVKNSSILSVVAGMDLMYFGDIISQETFNTFDTYILVGIFYLFLTVPLTLLTQHLEKRFSAGER